MVKIPIQKKSSFNWLWLIPAIVVIALIAWWLMGSDDTETSQYNNSSTAVIASNGAFAIGDSVQIERATVTELTGDMSFMINHEGQDYLVVFDERRTPGEATEGRYDINAGQTINISGEVMAANARMPSGVTATVPSGTKHYIFAENIEIQDRP